MARDWTRVRYRGDAVDVAELFDVYRVGDYIDATEENRRLHETSLRDELMKRGIRLTARISPRVHRLLTEAGAALDYTLEAEVFCLPDPSVNAYAILDVQQQGVAPIIGLTAGALEKLEDAEIRFLVGHEVGHFLFEHNRLNALMNFDEEATAATVLPSMGEALFLRWQKKAEISADRAGFLASGSLDASARALMKATFGLSERNLNLDVEALLSQIDELKGSPELMAEAFSSHPLLPIRLKALQLFAHEVDDDAREARVDDLMRLTRRHPSKPAMVAVMQAVADAGTLLLGADHEVSDEEVKILVHVLHQWFTDEPETVVLTQPDEIRRRLAESIAVINEKGEHDDKLFVLSRLADVALADGALLDAEGAVILETAQALQLPPREAYGVIVGAAQHVGFQKDPRLVHMADDLRASLARGARKPARSTSAPRPETTRRNQP